MVDLPMLLEQQFVFSWTCDSLEQKHLVGPVKAETSAPPLQYMQS